MKITNDFMSSNRSANLKRKAQDNEQTSSDSLSKSAVEEKKSLIRKTQTVVCPSNASDSRKCAEDKIESLGTFAVPQKSTVHVGIDSVPASDSLVDSSPKRPSVSKTPQPIFPAKTPNGCHQDDIECLGTFPAPRTIKTVHNKNECAKLEIHKGQTSAEHINNQPINDTSTKPALEKSSTHLTLNTSKVSEDSNFTTGSIKKCLQTPADTVKRIQGNECSASVKPNGSEQSLLKSSGKGYITQPSKNTVVSYIPRGPGNFAKVPFDFEIKQQVRYIPLKKKKPTPPPVLIKRVGFSNLNSGNKNLPLANCVLLVDNSKIINNGVKPDTVSKLLQPDFKQLSLKPNQIDLGDGNQKSKKVIFMGKNIVNLKPIAPLKLKPIKPPTSETHSYVPVKSKPIGCTQEENGSNEVPNENHKTSDQPQKVATVDQDTQTDIHCWLYKNNKLYLLEKDGCSSNTSNVTVIPVEKASAVNVQSHSPVPKSPVSLSSIDDDSLTDYSPEKTYPYENRFVASDSSASEACKSKALFAPERASQGDLFRTLGLCEQTATPLTPDDSILTTTNLPVQPSVLSFPLQVQDSSTNSISYLLQPNFVPESTRPPPQLQDLSARCLSFPDQSKVLPTLTTNLNMPSQVLTNESSYVAPRTGISTSEQSTFAPNFQAILNLQSSLANGGTSLPPYLEKVFSKICNDIKTCCLEDDSGNIPLHQAVLSNNIIKLKSQCIVLQAIKSHLNHTNLAHETALMLAVKLAPKTGSDAVSVLVAEGADQTIADREGSTPLHHAISHNLIMVAEILLAAHDADKAAEKFCSEGLAPLHLAAVGGHLEIIRLLVSKGVDINIKDRKSGRTPYFLALERGDLESAKLLVELKANIAEPNFAGQVPHLLEGNSEMKSQSSPLDRRMNLKKPSTLNDNHKNFRPKKRKLQREKVGKLEGLPFGSDTDKFNLNVGGNESVKTIHGVADQVQKNILDHSSLASQPTTVEDRNKDESNNSLLSPFSDLLLSPLGSDFTDPYSGLSFKTIPTTHVNNATNPLDLCGSNYELCENFKKTSPANNNKNDRPCVIQRVDESEKGVESNFPQKSCDHNFESKRQGEVIHSESKNSSCNDSTACLTLSDLDSRIRTYEANSQSNAKKVILTDHSMLSSSRSEQTMETTTPSTSVGCKFGDENIMQKDGTTERDAVFSTDSYKNLSFNAHDVEESVETPSAHSENELIDNELTGDEMDDESYEESTSVTLDYGSAETLSMVIGDCSLMSRPKSPSLTEAVRANRNFPNASDCLSFREDHSSDNCESARSSVQLTFNTYLDDIVDQCEEREPDNNVKLVSRRASNRGRGTNKKTEGTNENKVPGNGEESRGTTENLEHKQRVKRARTSGGSCKASNPPYLSTQGCSGDFPPLLTESEAKNQRGLSPATTFLRKSTRKRKL